MSSWFKTTGSRGQTTGKNFVQNKHLKTDRQTDTPTVL